VEKVEGTIYLGGPESGDTGGTELTIQEITSEGSWRVDFLLRVLLCSGRGDRLSAPRPSRLLLCGACTRHVSHPRVAPNKRLQRLTLHV
jgi:hypothetical protein